jgi:bifunctional non-homologous end joining protein LigD
VPAHLDGEERNWLIVRAAKDSAPGPPRQYSPMLPRPAKRLPAGPDWAFEIAWEGARALSPMEGARARFQHDEGDWLDKRCSRLLGLLPRALRTSELVLDGVICALDETGRPKRELLRKSDGPIFYMVFDMLDVEGESLVEAPWSARRERLVELLDDHVAEVRLSRAYDDGRALRSAARAQGLGIVAKRRGSPYRPGMVSDDWRLLPP